jgi:hypothetical protein
LTWGDGTPADNFKICVPDTSQGPCIGFGGYDPYLQSFYMACDDANLEMSDDDKRAAYAFEAAYTELTASDSICTCEDDWSGSQLAQIFCAGNAPLAIGGVNSATCMAPVSFDNTVRDATENAAALDGQITTIIEDDQTWCKMAGDGRGCKASESYTEPCSEERWMTLPNEASVQTAEKSQHEMFTALKARADSIQSRIRDTYGSAHPSISDAGLVGSYTAITFMPENTATGMLDVNDVGPWQAAIAAAQAVYEQYEKPSTGPAGQTPEEAAAAREIERQAEADKEALALEKEEKCEASAACKAMADSQECGTLATTAVENFGPLCDEGCVPESTAAARKLLFGIVGGCRVAGCVPAPI